MPAVALLPSSGRAAPARVSTAGWARRPKRGARAAAAAASSSDPSPTPLARIKVQELTPQAFAPYGWILPTVDDGIPFSQNGERGVQGLDAGTPRFYIMRLRAAARRLAFDRITHHKVVDQTLASVGPKEWYMGVAPPGTTPSPDNLAAFRIPPHTYIVLTRGCWHAGPLYVGGDGEEGEAAKHRDFFNAELADTNEVDYTTHRFGGWIELDV